MPVEFYLLEISPPCRGVWMTLEALGLKYNKHIIDIFKGDNEKAAFTTISPRGKIPAIKDGSLALAESKAIAAYLCNTYGKKSGQADLYPVDPKARARVDMVLYMMDDLHNQLLSYINLFGVLLSGEKPVVANLDKVHKTLELYEKFLSSTKFIAGDKMTVADFFAYISEGLLALTDFKDYAKYPKVAAWKKEMAKLAYHEKTCEQPLGKMKEMYKAKMKK